MEICMITFRSVTPAQRGEELLLRYGIRCTLRRTPRYMAEQGCGYSLRLHREQLQQAVELMRKQGIAFRKAYVLKEDEKPEEIRL